MADPEVHQLTRRPNKQRPPLRTYRRAFLLLAFYIPLVLIPWIFTMVLVYRPLNKSFKSSWNYAPGFSYKDYKLMLGLAKAIPILTAVAAILAIPITSAILAQAAVVMAERRYPGQQLSVRHLFSLADRAWCDWGALNNTWTWKEAGSARVKRFLFAGAVLIFLGAVQYPLFALLAPWKEITIPTCKDTSYIRGYFTYGMEHCDFDSGNYRGLGYTEIGIDLEPAQMAVIPASYVLPRIRNDLSTVSQWTIQPHFWQGPEDQGYRATARIDYAYGPNFVAALPADTTTGVLREHLMRLNSSVACANVSASEYPSTCSGANPFQASFGFIDDYYLAPNATIDICAPGEQGKYPWALSRNRQDISEEVFLKFSGTNENDGVLHCTAQTTRGYFELGNTHNEGTYGPLLEKWPQAGPPLEDYQFNDFVASEYNYEERAPAYIPSEEDHVLGGAIPIADPYINSSAPLTYTNTSGPLMTSILSLFGPSSWAHAVTNLTLGKSEDDLDTANADQQSLLRPLCDLMPFSRAGTKAQDGYTASCTRSLSGLMYTLSNNLAGWSNNDTATYRLRIAMFLSNQAILTSHTENLLPWDAQTGREIYTAPGVTVLKPVISLPAQIILSIIVGVQVLGLFWLGWFIYTWPTWTRTLDAMAVARVAASLDPGLLRPFRVAGLREGEKLAHVDGLVGVQSVESIHGERNGGVGPSDVELQEFGDNASTVGKRGESETVAEVPEGRQHVVLSLGGSGLIVKRGRKVTASSQGAGDV